MGKAQKKHGKGRLDHYYRLAKEKGYRARSSFKIVQLNQKYGFFNQPKNQKARPMCIIDLCAAPGSWCQVATQQCPLGSLIVGVDLDPIKPLPNVITFQSDITTEHCRSQLRGYLKTWKADVVMHDGAPNVGMAWAQDAFTQSELVLQSLRLAVEFTAPGGWFVTKVFRSKDYNKLMWVFNQFFEKCEATKPPSSRNVSAEIFVVCKNFLAPKNIDPRLLDPKYVFEELQDAKPNHQAKIYNPEKKTRKREGYEEGDYILFKRIPALDFVKCEDPITMLGETTQFTWDKKDEDYKKLKTLPQTTKDLLVAFDDLKVLGKKDFRTVLKWRLAARKLLELDVVEEKEEAPALTQEEQIEKELEEVTAAQQAKSKREKRKRQEQKMKEIMKLQLNMATPTDLGEDAGNNRDTLFDIKVVGRQKEQLKKLAKARSAVPNVSDAADTGDVNFGDDTDLTQLDHLDLNSESEAEDDILEIDSENEAEVLEAQLDNMYSRYKEQKQLNAEAQAKRAREREEWDGINSDKDDSDSDGIASMDEESDDSDYEYFQKDGKPNAAGSSSLSGRASMFFDNPLFEDVEAASDDSMEADTDSEDEGDDAASIKSQKSTSSKSEAPGLVADDEIVEESESESDFDPTKEEDIDQRNIKMTLAQQLALGQITKHDLINDGYNKISFRDVDGLPAWFTEDESRHSKRIKPITKEAAAAIKEQLKAMNARPIKKVAEAHARKKYKAQQRLEKIRKKSDLINDDATKSEREKADDIAKLMRRAKPKQRQKVTVIAAKGGNGGLKGRPKGVKGKYKMVDGTMKKESRALKRIAKKKKKN